VPGACTHPDVSLPKRRDLTLRIALNTPASASGCSAGYSRTSKSFLRGCGRCASVYVATPAARYGVLRTVGGGSGSSGARSTTASMVGVGWCFGLARRATRPPDSQACSIQYARHGGSEGFGCANVEVVRSVGDTLVRRRRASPSLLLRLWALAAAGAVPVRLRPAAGPETTRQDRVGY